MARLLIATAKPYIYAVPGLHNLVPLIRADATARYRRYLGDDVVFLGGTDEHGARIEIVALKQGATPRQLVDTNFREFSRHVETFGLSFDIFNRTTRTSHHEFVREFLRILEQNSFIANSTQELPYCAKCERILEDRFIEGACPYCGMDALGNQCKYCTKLLCSGELVNPRCGLCGASTTTRQSRQWTFDIPALSKQVMAYLDGNTNLAPELVSLAKSALENAVPLTITRDVQWGISAPFEGAAGKSIYVWLDALLAHLSAFDGVGSRSIDEIWRSSETHSLFFVGVDNVPFFLVLFPSLLMAARAGYNLPGNIVSNSFITYNGSICNKVTGKGIWLNEALSLLPADCWRFYIYMIYGNGRLGDTVDFNWKNLEEQLNSFLVRKLDYFVYGFVSALRKHWGGSIRHCSEGVALPEFVETETEAVHQFLDNYDYQGALLSILSLIDQTGEYVKSRLAEKRGIDHALHVGLRIVARSSVLLAFFLPATAAHVWRAVGLRGSVHRKRREIASEDFIVPGSPIPAPRAQFRLYDAGKLEAEYDSLLATNPVDWRLLLSTRNIGDWCPCEEWGELI